MASAFADWTADKLLSEFQSINQAAATEQGRLRANRARYTATLRSLASMPEGASKAAIKAQLMDWIHNQVAAENRFADYAAKWTAVKTGVKNFLQGIGITPPSYLGQLPLVPVALVTLLLAAGAIIVWMRSANNVQSKTMDAIENVIALARQQNWTPSQLKSALEAVKNTAKNAEPKDPFGVTDILQAALPVLLVIAAVMILPKILPQRAAA